jgi:hypothetical protein
MCSFENGAKSVFLFFNKNKKKNSEFQNVFLVHVNNAWGRPTGRYRQQPLIWHVLIILLEFFKFAGKLRNPNGKGSLV